MGESDQTKLNVIIAGRPYTLQGVESEEYIQQLAWYLDKKIDEAKRNKPMTGIIDVNSLYVIINIVDDLFKQREIAQHSVKKAYAMSEEFDAYKDEALRMIDDCKNKIMRLTEENALLKERLASHAIGGGYTSHKDNKDIKDTYNR